MAVNTIPSSQAAEGELHAEIAAMRMSLAEQAERMRQLWDACAPEAEEEVEEAHAAMRNFTAQLLEGSGGAAMPEYPLPGSFTPPVQEEIFEEILRMYALGDEIMAAVAKEGIMERAVQMEIARPFCAQLCRSATILSAFYIDVVRCGRPVTPEVQDIFEKAFQSVFYAIRDFLDGAEEKLPAASSL